MIFFIAYPLYLFINATTLKDKKIDPKSAVSEGQSLLRDGDLVVRLNRDFTSQFIKNFNRHDKSFSHSGMVLFENGRPYVFHMISGGENPDGKMKKDLLEQFWNPRKNSSYGIYRYDISRCEIQKLKGIVYKWYAQGLQFDSAFNLSSDNKMYCAEMISKALYQATNKRISIESTQLTKREVRLFSMYRHLSFSDTSKIQMIAIDNLYTNPYCHLVKRLQWRVVSSEW
jgi:hypothetical protein